MQNQIFHDGFHPFEIKQEPKDEFPDPDLEDNKLSIRTLVLKFVRDQSNGTYSVVPFIKPDPFFEEQLEDCCQDEKYSLHYNSINTTSSLVDEKCIKTESDEYRSTDKAVTINEEKVSKSSKYFKTTTCTQCLFTGPDQKVRRHMQRVHPKIIHHCPFCKSRGFKERLTLEAHILGKHMDLKEAQLLITRKIYSCDFCVYRSLKRGNFGRHLTIHGDKSLKKRLQEPRDINNSDLLKENKSVIRMALEKPNYCCHHCFYNTKDKGSIIKHVRLHRPFNEMPFVCKVCSWKFNEKNSLDSHIVNRHLDNIDMLKTVTNGVYECELCDYRDVNKNKVLRHKRARHAKKKGRKRFEKTKKIIAALSVSIV